MRLRYGMWTPWGARLQALVKALFDVEEGLSLTSPIPRPWSLSNTPFGKGSDPRVW